jgi:orotate phosphoribosyltransferase
MKTIIPTAELGDTDPLKLLARCGGFYQRPYRQDGSPAGPLVGYAGTYESGKHFVGEVYVNFAMAERHGPVLDLFARRLIAQSYDTLGSASLDGLAGFCGAPEGGKALATALAVICHRQYIFPEKRVTAVKTADSREESELVFDRHTPNSGEGWLIVEDVCNNFSTTAKLIALIEKTGARVAGIVCFLNRSEQVDSLFVPNVGDGLPCWPVISVVRQVIPQYRQDDPKVATEVQAGNVVWKPKNDWARLAKAMADNP